jgi:glycosyltransferase involved in cell wall biosynthesis
VIDARSLQFSIIIPIYNDWAALEGCMQSLAEQAGTSEFEVIIVDDGSHTPAPESIHRFSDRFPLTIAWQPHSGIATARNRGIQESKGMTLIFTDADCRLDSNCLSMLNEATSHFPHQNHFQLHLVGDSSNLLGRAEGLRLISIQDHSLESSGRIRYLNTSGFAIRRAVVDSETGLFDPTALRSEDTLLLANLIQKGELPFFVTNAVIRHTVQMSFIRCIRKDIQVAVLESRTFDRIAAKGLRVRMRNSERVALLRSMWGVSGEPSIRRPAWFVAIARQALQRAVSLLYRLLPFHS